MSPLPRLRNADSHLTYIGAAGRHTTYDVYRRDGGVQLGQVTHFPDGWEAFDFASAEPSRRSNTRWQAACELWGDL